MCVATDTHVQKEALFASYISVTFPIYSTFPQVHSSSPSHCKGCSTLWQTQLLGE